MKRATSATLALILTATTLAAAADAELHPVLEHHAHSSHRRRQRAVAG